MELRIIVAGSRQYNNYEEAERKIFEFFRVFNECNKGKSFSGIKFISGTARGADSLGERFAEENGYELVRFPADWDKFGKRAGVLRNAEMAKYASVDGHKGVLIVFWDGKSRGTEHMINIAKRYGLEIYYNHIEEDKESE